MFGLRNTQKSFTINHIIRDAQEKEGDNFESLAFNNLEIHECLNGLSYRDFLVIGFLT